MRNAECIWPLVLSFSYMAFYSYFDQGIHSLPFNACHYVNAYYHYIITTFSIVAGVFWLGVSKVLEGDMARTADPSWPKRYSMMYPICSDIKPKRKEEEGNMWLWCLSYGANAAHTQVLLPGKWLDITCWWEVDHKSFPFSSTCNLVLYLTHEDFFILFAVPPFLSWFAEKRSNRAAWRAPDILPKGVHQKALRPGVRFE